MAKLKSLRSLGVAVAALLASAAIALGAGIFQGYPIVGGAAYCLSFVMNPLTGAATTTCNGPQAPAGPTVITGNELIPADTQLAQGQAPQTVLLKPAGLGAGPYQYVAPLTGATVTLTAQQRRLILEPAGTIAALTVVWPAAAGLVDNQLMGICTRQIVTTLTTTNGSGATVLDAPTALLVPVATGAASCVEWVYRLANTSWYRVQ